MPTILGYFFTISPKPYFMSPYLMEPVTIRELLEMSIHLEDIKELEDIEEWGRHHERELGLENIRNNLLVGLENHVGTKD